MIQYLAFAAALVAAVATIVLTVRPQLPRIRDLLLHGPQELPPRPEKPSAAHWRRVHLEADRRKPFAPAARRAAR